MLLLRWVALLLLWLVLFLCLLGGDDLLRLAHLLLLRYVSYGSICVAMKFDE